jgi:hypothetical protein
MITLLFWLLCKADHRPFHPLKVLRKAHFHKKIKNIYFPVRLLQNPSGVFAREKSEYSLPRGFAAKKRGGNWK